MRFILRAKAGEVDTVEVPVQNFAFLHVNNLRFPVVLVHCIEFDEFNHVLSQIVIVLLLHRYFQVHQDHARQQEAADASRVGISESSHPESAFEDKG